MVSEERTHVTILGIDFFHGTVQEAVRQMCAGALLVVPAVPALKEPISRLPVYPKCSRSAEVV